MAEFREDGDISSAVTQKTANEAFAPARQQTTSEVIVGSPLNRSSNLKTSDDTTYDAKDSSFTFQNASSLCTTSQEETIDDSAPTHSFEDKDLPENKQSDPSVFSYGNNVSPRKQPNACSTLLDVGNKVASLTESRAASENGNKAPYTVYCSFFIFRCSNAHTSSSHRPCRSFRSVYSFSSSIQKCSFVDIFHYLLSIGETFQNSPLVMSGLVACLSFLLFYSSFIN